MGCAIGELFRQEPVRNGAQLLYQLHENPKVWVGKMDRLVRAIPGENREADVDLEQQRLKEATEKASEEAAVRKRKCQEDHEEAKRQRKLEGKGPGQPAAVLGPVQQHSATPVQPQQHDSSTAKRKEEQEQHGSNMGSNLTSSLLLAQCLH